MAVMEMVTITLIPSNTYTKQYQHQQQHQVTANQATAKPSKAKPSNNNTLQQHSKL